MKTTDNTANLASSNYFVIFDEQSNKLQYCIEQKEDRNLIFLIIKKNEGRNILFYFFDA